MKVKLLFQLNLKKLNRVKALFHTSTKAVLSRSQQNVLGQLRLYTYMYCTQCCADIYHYWLMTDLCQYLPVSFCFKGSLGFQFLVS